MSPLLWIVAVSFSLLSGSFGYADDAAKSLTRESAALLTVKVTEIQQRFKGEVGVALYNGPVGYPTHFEHTYETEWAPLKPDEATVKVEFDGLPPGDYAVSVLHDANGNRMVDRSTLGFPKEGVGFSNGQKVYLSAPKYKKCKFPIAAGEKKEIVIPLDYPAD